MKALFLILSALTFVHTSFAQRTIKFEVSLIYPAHGSSIEIGSTYTQEFVIKNLGPDSIKPTDTIGYGDPSIALGSYVYRLGYTKAVGDTIQIKRNIYFPAGTPEFTDEYCVYAFAQNLTDRLNFDTSGITFEDCNTVTLTKAGTSIENAIKESTTEELLNISPNPASAVVTFDFTSRGNSEIVAQLYDIAGRVVLSNNYGQSFAGQKGFTLDISTLNSGLYFVALRQGEYKAMGKLTKQ
jgi:hypothetical protein